MLKEVQGGVCAAKGFTANGVHCGIRKNKTKRDLALIVSETQASAAAVYTQNLVKGAPLTVTKNNIANGKASAVICNSGNANTCNANGIEIAEKTCQLLANELGIDKTDVVVASTGVIGQPLDITPIANGIPALVKGLGAHSDLACEGIMTTDTRPKEIAFEFCVGGKTCRIGGIAKGSGMIHPNMATMLVFVTTDCSISAEMLNKALLADVQDSFNMISVDGDTECGNDLSLPSNRKGRRGRNQALRMQGLRCEGRKNGEGSGKIGDLFFPFQSGNVRRGRKLGPCAVRYRVFGCGRRRYESGRMFPLGKGQYRGL